MTDALDLLSRYIQFDTSHHNEMAAAEWLAGVVRERGITNDVRVLEPEPGRGLVIARIQGRDPALKPLIVSHHIDVVAADPTQWTHAPFGGEIADGVVYGRGAFDDKGMGVAHLLALDALVREGARFRRGVVFTAVPDEETNGAQGTGWLVSHMARDLDPEWVWDEGGSGYVDFFGPGVLWGVANCEKQVHRVRVTAQGTPGHGSMPHTDNPNDKLVIALRRVLWHDRPLRLSETTREMLRIIAQRQPFPASALLSRLENSVVQRVAAARIKRDPQLNALLRDTISLTILRGGYQGNVIPERAEAELDCRLLPETDPDEFDAWLRGVLGRRVAIEVLERSPRTPVAPLQSALYEALTGAALAATPGAAAFPLQMPGATDSRFWRAAGVPGYGLAPFLVTRQDLAAVHGIDERISGANLELGVRIAQDVITRVCLS